MKYIQTRFILYAMLTASPLAMNAQTAENETESAAGDPLVQVAYRKVAQSDLLGSISVINYEELTEKNYNTYANDNLQGYVDWRCTT